MNDFRSFLEISRDFHKELSKHERVSSYYAFALAAGTTAMAGTGVYIAVESDATIGLIAAGLSGWATKIGIEMGRKSLEWSRKNAALAEERQTQIENFEELFEDGHDF